MNSRKRRGIKFVGHAGVSKEWSAPMLDRHWLGDLSLAVLIALPLVALAWPQPVAPTSVSSPAVSIGQSDRLPGKGRIGLLG